MIGPGYVSPSGLVFRGLEGDFRDWADLRQWADGIARQLAPASR
jgi:hypothetical protein